MKQRFYGLDNLKIALTVLVIAHHAGQPYGGSGGFWYFESSDTLVNLGSFFSVNAGFFMSLFFFVSAYFTPASYDRKGPGSFLTDRMKKVGLPLLFGFLVMIPLLMYAYYIHFRGYPEMSFWSYYTDVYFGLADKPAGWTGPSWPDMQFAHLWFLEHLLVYAVLYALLRYASGGKRKIAIVKREPLKTYQVLLFACIVSLATFVVRTQYPIDEWTGFLGLIQTEFAHVPQYAALFFAGMVAYRKDWLSTLTAKAGMLWLIVGLSIAALRYASVLSVYARGGWSILSLAYSVIETLLCISLSIGLIWLFRDAFNKTNVLAGRLSSAAFMVYVIHVPVLVILQYALADSNIPTSAKFAIVTIAGALLSFAVSLLIQVVWRNVVRKLAKKVAERSE